MSKKDYARNGTKGARLNPERADSSPLRGTQWVSFPSPQSERDRLEQQLLEEMQAAEKAYSDTVSEHRKIRTEFGDMLDHPDSVHAVNQAANKERRALEKYARALRAFTDSTVDGRRPIPPGVSGS